MVTTVAPEPVIQDHPVIPVIEDYPVAPAIKKPITREEIIAVFKRTGLSPVYGDWGDGVKTACVLTALKVDRTGHGWTNEYVRGIDLGFTEDESSAIVAAWDTDGVWFSRTIPACNELIDEVHAARIALHGYLPR